MFETDSQIISYALQMWANHIETGDVTISRNDAVRCNEHREEREQIKIKELSSHQENFVMRLRKMSNDISNEGFNDRNNS